MMKGELLELIGAVTIFVSAANFFGYRNSKRKGFILKEQFRKRQLNTK